jgi:hypothetical protein
MRECKNSLILRGWNMSEKTYITPGKLGPELIMKPYGHKDPVGNKIQGKSILFMPNAARIGQYTTSDPEEQAFLEGHERFKFGGIIILPESIVNIAKGPDATQVSTGVKTTPVKEPVKPTVNAKKKKGARIAK